MRIVDQSRGPHKVDAGQCAGATPAATGRRTADGPDPAAGTGQANAELSKSGVPFDLTQLKAEQLEALVEHLDELTVEVDQADAKVCVFCE
jgi:hypothetical protein